MSVFDLHDELTRALPADSSRSKSTTTVTTSHEGTPGTPCGLEKRTQVVASCMSFSMQGLTLHPPIHEDAVDVSSDDDSDSGEAGQQEPPTSCSAALLKVMQSQQEEEQNRDSLVGIPAMHPRKPQPMAYQTALGQKDIFDMDRDERFLKARARLNRRWGRTKKQTRKQTKKQICRERQLVRKSTSYRDKMKARALKAYRLSNLNDC